MTDTLFQALIKQEFAIRHTSELSASTFMSHEEENALRYVGGYVVRKVLDDFERENKSPEPSEEVLLLISFWGDEATGRRTEDWTDMLDRGGLWHINDDIYSLFSIMEEVCRAHLSNTPLKDGVVLGLEEALQKQ